MRLLCWTATTYMLYDTRYVLPQDVIAGIYYHDNRWQSTSIGYIPAKRDIRPVISRGVGQCFALGTSKAILTWGVSCHCQQSQSDTFSQLWLTQNPPDRRNQAAI